MDIVETSAHLPDPVTNGGKFAIDLLVFCKHFRPTIPELRDVLALRMSATNVEKIAEHVKRDEAAKQPE